MVRAGRFNPVLLVLGLVLSVAIVPAGSAATVADQVSLRQTPAIPEIQLFIPSSGSIHSTQVHDAINGKDGLVLFATSFGLSEYNGSWSTRHLTRSDLRFSLLDDFITALEYDHEGNLWIGYAEGIQVDNGSGYQTIRDQQLLKSLRIKDFQRWGDTMWVAAGNSGIHRFSGGNWTWFKPMSSHGPGFYEIDSMALDPRNDVLYVATEDKGIWQVTNASDRILFERIDTSEQVPAPVLHVRRSPLGGAYFFDRETITWYSPEHGWRHILSISDLQTERTVINDIEVAPDETLFIGTDNGIFIWKETVIKRIARFEGTGSSAVITWLFLDAENRLWFATQGNVGFYYALETVLPMITIQIPEYSPETTITSGSIPESVPEPSMGTQAPGDGYPAGVPQEPTILDRLIQFLSGLIPG